METFDIPIHAKPTNSVKFNTLSTAFGDGYVQEMADGINNRKEGWSIEVSGENAKDAKNFFDRHEGYKSFYWKTPLGDVKKFKCRSGYSLTHIHTKLFSLTASFEEVV